MLKRGFGIKAYGQWHRFETWASYEQYLNDWIIGTDGAERDRAVRALSVLHSKHVHYYDSDNDLEL